MILLSHIIDLDTPSYGNRAKITIEKKTSIKDGSSSNTSKWVFPTNHLGTHIDMPRHFVEHGQTITDMPINFWHSNKIHMLEISCLSAKMIEVSDLHEVINPSTEILLIRTGYEKFRGQKKYWDENPGLSADLGKYITSVY